MELKRDKPSDYLPLLYYDNVAVSGAAVRMMRDIAGAEHILLGSDYVFAGAPEPVTGNLEEAGLNSNEISLICCDNARKLFLKEG